MELLLVLGSDRDSVLTNLGVAPVVRFVADRDLVHRHECILHLAPQTHLSDIRLQHSSDPVGELTPASVTM